MSSLLGLQFEYLNCLTTFKDKVHRRNTNEPNVASCHTFERRGLAMLPTSLILGSRIWNSEKFIWFNSILSKKIIEFSVTTFFLNDYPYFNTLPLKLANSVSVLRGINK